MNAARSCNTQVSLLTELYQALEQRAKVRGHSVNNKIVALLAASLSIEIGVDLTTEFTSWETGSDEDWLNMEARLVGKVL